MSQDDDLSPRQVGILLTALLVIALCGIVYELIIGTISSYLLGNSVYQFSITIGLFMFAMGLGSLLTRHLNDEFIPNFIRVEIAIALVGGLSGVILFLAFPFVRVIYELTMFSLIIVIGALVGMEIPILTALLSQSRGTKQSIAEVMSFDYIGALIGSVAFPLLLLPSLGLIQSSFVIGLINALVALTTAFVFRARLRGHRWYVGASAAVVVLLFAGLLAGSFLTRFAEKHLYFDQVVFASQTPYQKLVLTRSFQTNDQRLYIDGHIQYSSRDEYRYHEYLVHPLMSLSGDRRRVLILGGGDGLALREVLKYRDVEDIEVVDIDPEMLRIASELPALARLNGHAFDDPRVTAIAEDAFSFINQPGEPYDRVIVDMPDPHNEALNKLYSKEFYTMISKRLAPGGGVVTQSSSPFYTRRAFWCIRDTLAAVYPQTVSYHTALPSFGIWGFNLALSTPREIGEWPIDVPTRAMNDQSMTNARQFDEDMGPVPGPVNSIFEARLYHLYLVGLRS